MSMFNKIKGLFYEEDPNAKKSSSQSNATNQSAPKKSSSSASQPKVKIDLSNEKADGKFVDVLMKAIEANNLDGFDYLEYKQSLQSLAKMEMNEQTKYQSAFAMAKTMGATPAKLVKSAGHYLTVLQKEQTKFNQALKNQKDRQITGKEQEIKDFESTIIKKQKQIETLKAEIEQHKKSLEKIKSGINQATSKVESTNRQFQVAYQLVVGQIEKDVENMKAFLK